MKLMSSVIILFLWKELLLLVTNTPSVRNPPCLLGTPLRLVLPSLGREGLWLLP